MLRTRFNNHTIEMRNLHCHRLASSPLSYYRTRCLLFAGPQLRLPRRAQQSSSLVFWVRLPHNCQECTIINDRNSVRNKKNAETTLGERTPPATSMDKHRNRGWNRHNLQTASGRTLARFSGYGRCESIVLVPASATFASSIRLLLSTSQQCGSSFPQQRTTGNAITKATFATKATPPQPPHQYQHQHQGKQNMRHSSNRNTSPMTALEHGPGSNTTNNNHEPLSPHEVVPDRDRLPFYSTTGSCTSPSTWTLLKSSNNNNNNDKSDLWLILQSPLGSLTPNQIQALRDAYQYGQHLVAMEQLQNASVVSPQAAIDTAPASTSLFDDYSDEGGDSDYGLSEYRGTATTSTPQPEIRQWNSGKIVGRQRQPRQTQKPRGTLIMDWSHLTNLVLEGWILLDRIVAEMDHKKRLLRKGHTAEKEPTPPTLRNRSKQSRFLELKPNLFRSSEAGESNEPDSHAIGYHPVAHNTNRTSRESSTTIPLMPWVLQTWRTIHLYELPIRGPCQQQLPTVAQVYQCIAACLDHDLLAWSSHLVNFHLDVVQATEPNYQQAARLGQEVFEALVMGKSTNRNNGGTDSPMALVSQEEVLKDRNHVSLQQRDQTMRWKDDRYPDRDLISKLLNMVQKSGQAEAPHYALQLLQLLVEVQELFPETDKFIPDSFVYAAVLRCWATAGTAPVSLSPGPTTTQGWHEQPAEISSLAGPVALKLLKDAERKYEVLLTKPLLDAVFKCLTRTYDPRCQKHALDLFRRRVAEWRHAVESLQQPVGELGRRRRLLISNIGDYRATMERLEPNREAYWPLVENLVRSGQVHQAISLLQLMESVARETNQPSVAPTDRCYSHVQSALNRKTQAHGRHHDPRLPFLHWSSSSTSSLQPEKSSTQWEEAAWHTLKQIEMELQQTMSWPSSHHNKNAEQQLSVAVRNAFALFDKVAEQSFRHASEVDPQFLPWPTSALGQAVNAWKQLRVIPKLRNKSRNMAYNNNASIGTIWGPECRAPLTDPRWLLNRLNNYCAVGLFRPSGDLLDFMLDLVLMCAGKGNHENAAILSLALVEFLLEHCGDPARDACFPDRVLFRRLIQIWRDSAAAAFLSDRSDDVRWLRPAKTTPFRWERRSEAVEVVEDIIHQLHEWYTETKMVRYRPDTGMYANLVETWNYSLGSFTPRRVAQRASQLLESWKTLMKEQTKPEIEGFHDEGDCEENVLKLYLAIVRAHSTFGAALSNSRKNASTATINEIQSLLDELIQICNEGRYPSFAEHANRLMFPLVECLGQIGRNPERLHHAIDNLQQLSHVLNDDRVRPTRSCYNALIRAYGNAGNLEQAEKVLQQAVDMVVPKGHVVEQHQPTEEVHSHGTDATTRYSALDSWHAILEAWSKSQSSEAPRSAMDILQQLDSSIELRPSLQTCNLVLQCFLNATAAAAVVTSASGDHPGHFKIQVVEEARALVDRMEKDDTAELKPNRDTYLYYMTLLKTHFMPDEAYNVLKRFCEFCENGTVDDCPDVRHFNLAIWAFATQQQQKQPNDARQHRSPDGSDEGEDAFAKVCDVFQMMSDASYIFQRLTLSDQSTFYAEPNEETYRGLLQVALQSPLQPSSSSSSSSSLQALGMKSADAATAEESMRRSEAVLEWMIRQNWHEKAENTEIALGIFRDVLEHWKSCRNDFDHRRRYSYQEGDATAMVDGVQARISILEHLIQTVQEDFDKNNEKRISAVV